MRVLRIVFVTGLFLAAWTAAAGTTQALDLASRSHEDLAALQQRLKDSGCYTGALDGDVSASLDAAVKACPSQDPVLRIETGMHTAAIQRIAVDAGCRAAVTASEDKTVRVWSMPEGKLAYTLRLPIGDGFLGQVLATAVTPDGTLAAVGGYDAAGYDNSPIYLFDVATGRNLRRLGKTGGAIEAIAFSSDGKRVASGGGGGIHMFDVESGRELMSDPHVSRYSYGVTFGPDGSLYATLGEDGLLRRYGPDGTMQKAVKTRGGKVPYSLALDPTGHRIAVGFIDTKAVEFFDAATLRHAGYADTRDLKTGSFIAVSWSKDGQVLFAGGDAKDAVDVKFVIRRFTATGQRIGGDAPVADHSVEDLAACGDGVAFATADPSFGVLHPDGTGAILKHGREADMRLKLKDAFTVSDDGTRVRFGLSIGNTDPVLFDLLGGQTALAPQPLSDLSPADAAIEKLHITGRFGFAPGDMLRAIALRSDQTGFMLGTSFFLMSIDARNGTQLRWSKQATGETGGVNLARGGDLVLAAFIDGTLRWYRWSDGAELLALFVDRYDKRWVAWTPAGYYMASPGGEDLIGWHVNRGWNQAADFFPASRFRARFNRPDVVRLVLRTLDENEAVKQANETSRRREDVKPLIAQLPPVIRIFGPTNGSHISTGTLTLDYGLRSPSGQPVDHISVLVNGRPIKEIGLPSEKRAADVETKSTLSIPLTQRASDVALIAWSGDLAGEPVRATYVWDGAPAAATQARKLHALVVGVSAYSDPDMTLAFAAKDARDFAKALEDQQGAYYTDVQTRVLLDRDVTRTSLIDGLEWLERNAGSPDDFSVLYLAGHGITDAKQMYWFFPSDADADSVRSKGVSQDEIRHSLQSLSGKVIWFLDTCHAGGAAKRSPVDMNVLVNTVTSAENGGIVVFAASKGQQLSLERPEWGNGAFTKAIVEGIGLGKADLLGKGLVTTSSLDTFIESRVNDLTEGTQSPVMERPPEEPDFAIAKISRH